jgi:hypothetical protein
MRHKFRKFAATVLCDSLDIIAITETWLKTGNRDYIGEYSLPGYNILNRDRENRAGGGLMIYIKNNINITEVTLTNATSSELQCIDIGNEIKYRIILAYRPPNNSVTNDEIL